MRPFTSHHRRLVQTCLVVLLLAPFALSNANAQVTYSYTGIPIGPSGVYAANTMISVSITLATPLPRDSTLDLSGVMTSYTFADGVQTLTERNSTFDYGEASVTTDSAGIPLEWRFLVHATPLPVVVGEPISGIWMQYFANNNSIFEAAFSGIPCATVTNGVCLFTSPGAVGGFVDAAGGGLVLLGSSPPPPWAISGVAFIPTLGPVGSIVLTTALGLLGLLVLRRFS